MRDAASSAHTLTQGPTVGAGFGPRQVHSVAACSFVASAAECAHGRLPAGMLGTLELDSIGGAVAAGIVAAAANSRIGLPAPLLSGTATALPALAAATLPALFRRSPRIRWSR